MNTNTLGHWLRLQALRARRHFGSRLPETRSLCEIFHDQRLSSERLVPCVRIAYVFPAFWMSTRLFTWEPLVSVQQPMWLWPVAWLGWFEGDLASRVLLGACTVMGWLTSVFCERRWARVFAPIALTEFLGLCFSTGKIHHLMHGWLFALVALLALPPGWHTPRQLTREARVRCLLVFALAQTLFALTYSLSGVGKVFGGIYQAFRLELTSFHPQALPRHVAARLLETDDTSLLGHWAILHGVWLWPLVLATMYLQLFALHFAARPRLHRLFAFGVGAFHLSSALFLFIDFTPAIVLAALLFGASVTAPERVTVRELMGELPLFGRLVRSAHRLGMVPNSRAGKPRGDR